MLMMMIVVVVVVVVVVTMTVMTKIATESCLTMSDMCSRTSGGCAVYHVTRYRRIHDTYDKVKNIEKGIITLKNEPALQIVLHEQSATSKHHLTYSIITLFDIKGNKKLS